MLTARVFSSFLKFNSKECPSKRAKDQDFNGLTALKPISDFDPKWGEVGVGIVVVKTLLALQSVNDPICQRCS